MKCLSPDSSTKDIKTTTSKMTIQYMNLLQFHKAQLNKISQLLLSYGMRYNFCQDVQQGNFLSFENPAFEHFIKIQNSLSLSEEELLNILKHYMDCHSREIAGLETSSNTFTTEMFRAKGDL